MAAVYQLRQHGSVATSKHNWGGLVLPVGLLVLVALMMHYLGVIPD
ncbi:MAG: hypothetical protein Q8K32_32040 [Archangium sp.]|nr:hypothetical protein [Archangium sp.]